MMKKKALIVGLNYYESIRPLYGCVNDAKNMNGVLAHHGDEAENKNFDTKLMLAENPSSAIDRRDLKNAIKTLFKDKVDIALFYFSGHGHNESTGGYLVTSECVHGDDGLAMTEILKIVNDSEVDYKILVLDCCFAGQMGLDIQKEISSLGDGVYIISSSTADQVSEEEAGQGVFTRLMVEALQGSASDILGDIYLDALYQQIIPLLSLWDQQPTRNLYVTGRIPLRKVKPSVTRSDLSQITALFPHKEDIFPLDPSYEPESAAPIAEHTAKFATLQKYNRVNLVVPIDTTHMYHAAMESTGCKLTNHGQFYWRLVQKGRL